MILTPDPHLVPRVRGGRETRILPSHREFQSKSIEEDRRFRPRSVDLLGDSSVSVIDSKEPITVDAWPRPWDDKSKEEFSLGGDHVSRHCGTSRG